MATPHKPSELLPFSSQFHREFSNRGAKILAAEATQMSHDAYFCKSSHNAYLNEDDTSKPADDVTRQQEQTYVGSVPYDRIDDNRKLKHLYLWDPLKDFIGYVLGKNTFYRFADPLGACSINVFVEGGEHGWHFDESEYTVMLMLQADPLKHPQLHSQVLHDVPDPDAER